MSSYLNLYIKRKDDDKYTLFYSESRNGDIYTYMDENMEIPFAYNDDSKKKLEEGDLDTVIQALDADIRKVSNRISVLKENAAGNMDIIQDILDSRDYMNDLKVTRNRIGFIRDIVSDAEFNDNIEGIYCNIC